MQDINIFSLEAEQTVIGCLLYEPSLIPEMKLHSYQFFVAKHREVVQAVEELAKKDKPIDLVTLVEQLGDRLEQAGGIGYIADMMNAIPTIENFTHYENIVLEKWKARQALAAANILVKSLHNHEDVTETLNTAVMGLSKLEETGLQQEFNMRESLMNLTNNMLSHTGEMRGITYGYDEMNKITGGMHEGQLIIVAARPSVGKTAYAGNVGIHAAIGIAKKEKEGAVVALFSLETPEGDLLKRMISNLGNINASYLENPNSRMMQDDWNKYYRTTAFLEKLDINIYDSSTVTVQEIRSTMRKLKRNNPGRRIVCIIDYLQLIQANIKGGTREQEISHISRSLKIMARELEMPVIALSQLSRAVEQRQDKRPMLSDLRESGSIEQDADIVQFLYREDYYEKETENKNIIEIIIAKHRNGPLGTVQLSFLKEYSKFIDISKRNEGS